MKTHEIDNTRNLPIQNTVPNIVPTVPVGNYIEPVDKVTIGESSAPRINYSNSDPQIRILNHTLDLIKAGNSQIVAADKEIVLVCGDTGAGKSTLVNYLIGNELNAVKPANSRKLHIESAGGFTSGAKIGHGVSSETFIPQKIENPNSPFVFWDCPGFEDTRGPSIDIANAFYINKLFITAEKIKIMVVTDESSINGPRRGQPFKELIGRLGEIFVDKKDLVNSMTLVFTKVRDIDDFRTELTHLVVQDNELENAHRDLLLSVIKDSQIATFSIPNVVGTICPGEREQILRALTDTSYCEKPEVNITVSSTSLIALQKLTTVVNSQIKSNVKALSTTLMAEIDKISLDDLQQMKINLEKLKNEKFSEKETLEFIDEHIINKILSCDLEIDKTAIEHIFKEIECAVEYFDSFFKKILPHAEVESDKLVGTFLLNSLYPIEQAITKEVYKENQVKLDKAVSTLEASKQDFKTQLDKQATAFDQQAKNNEARITALSQQLSDANKQRVNQQKIYELKENFNALRQAIEHRQNIINNRGNYNGRGILGMATAEARYNEAIIHATNNINNLMQATQNNVNNSLT